MSHVWIMYLFIIDIIRPVVFTTVVYIDSIFNHKVLSVKAEPDFNFWFCAVFSPDVTSQLAWR